MDLASPAIDAIDQGSTAYGEPYLGSAPDLGAHEYHLTGDINRDNYVNVGDLQVLVAAWGSQKTPPSGNWNIDADLSNDGYINVGDLQLLVPNWGRCL